MTAWSNNFADAPREETIIVRNADWDCPVFMYWLEEEGWQGWSFAERMLEEANDPPTEDELKLSEWALIPT